ncbi:Transposable element P transposase [Frankliniella fusca]|uniref:Transposable element P transposase n=1 Tax=Frankliniella fusca TaxID=407009 RepID=A0AAE1HE69_9NEOP|nr:Transposable element P transposase [Frankliniella fusca]
MEIYRDVGYAKLHGCEGSVKMCRLINNLADTMNSNRPQNSVNLQSPQLQAIDDFLEYFIALKAWANKKLHAKLELAEKSRVENLRAQGKKPKGKSKAVLEAQEDYIFSDSTDIGLIVSLKAAKELIVFLITKCNHKYVMTARFNQEDALERFFGLVRQSCGGNTHPEPRVFAQLFRLLSIYSLVKPVRGSNITGGQMVTTLLNLEDLNTKTKEERKDALSKKIDEIISNGENLEDIPELMEHVDHNYIGETIDEFALAYVGGYVARHAKKYCHGCDDCLKSLRKTEGEATDVDMFIKLKSKGYLTYPSDTLIHLLHQLEQKIVSTSLNNELEGNILFVVLEKLQNIKVECIGCDLHKTELTKSIMKFFLITRMHFLTKRWNERTKEAKKAYSVTPLCLPHLNLTR